MFLTLVKRKRVKLPSIAFSSFCLLLELLQRKQNYQRGSFSCGFYSSCIALQIQYKKKKKRLWISFKHVTFFGNFQLDSFDIEILFCNILSKFFFRRFYKWNTKWQAEWGTIVIRSVRVRLLDKFHSLSQHSLLRRQWWKGTKKGKWCQSGGSKLRS